MIFWGALTLIIGAVIVVVPVVAVVKLAIEMLS